MKYLRCAVVSQYIGDPNTFESLNIRDIVKNVKMTNTDIIDHLMMILSTLDHLHCAGLVIGDLKADNCLYDKVSNMWKVVDMGMSILQGTKVDYMWNYGIRSPDECQSFLKMHRQIAPETVYFNILGKESDIYRVGRIIEYVYNKRESLKPFLQPIAEACLSTYTLRPKLKDVYSYLFTYDG